MTTPLDIVAHGWGWRHASRIAWAVRDVSVRISAGERVLVLGASGSGKSTFLQGMAGVLGDGEDGEAEGTMLIGGVQAPQARGSVGMILQDPDAQVMLARVGDDIAFGCENLGVPRDEIWRRVDESLELVGLDVARDRATNRLSGGQKQRMALAGVLAMQPGVIVLDEPTANLDPAGVIEVRDGVAHALAERAATLIVVEHRVDVWLPLVDRVIVLGDGGIVADGTPTAVFGEHSAALSASGVWVPGAEVPSFLPSGAAGPGLLATEGLAVGRERGVAVAHAPDMTINARDVLAIVGPNGAGKSTLGLTLGGLIPPTSGRVLALPELLTADAPKQTRAGRKQRLSLDEPFGWASKALLTRIGSVLQEPEHQLLARTVREELAVGLRALGTSDAEREARIDDLLDRLGLTALAKANPYTLSGGQKRRLTVAAAIATAPRLLILDEPTFGQDAATWRELVRLLAELRDSGCGIITVTHDLDLVASLGAKSLALPPGPDGGDA